jgi:hypothetical protein
MQKLLHLNQSPFNYWSKNFMATQQNAIPVYQEFDHPGEVTLSTEAGGELAVNIDAALEQAKVDLAAIDEKAEFAIQVVTQSIRTQAAVAKGKVLLQLKESYPVLAKTGRNAQWSVFLESLGIPNTQATKWINSAKAVIGNGDEYGEEFLLQFPVNALATIQTLPDVIKEAVLEDAVEAGEPPKQTDVEELAKKPQTKLAAALEKLDEIDVDDDVKIDKMKDTITQLKSQIAEEKIKVDQQAKENERVTAELELLQYDDSAAREQRIKRVSNQLIVSIPSVLSDLQKYVAEKEHYPSKTTKSLDASLETLVNFLKPLYA